MAMQPISNMVSAEQLMLTKLQSMQQQIQPDFVVSSNPADKVQSLAPMSFSGAMKGVLDRVNEHQSLASNKMSAVETGQSDDLVGAMVASQKASLSFSALMQVRNKVVSSFDEIMKMPV